MSRRQVFRIEIINMEPGKAQQCLDAVAAEGWSLHTLLQTQVTIKEGSVSVFEQGQERATERRVPALYCVFARWENLPDAPPAVACAGIPPESTQKPFPTRGPVVSNQGGVVA